MISEAAKAVAPPAAPAVERNCIVTYPLYAAAVFAGAVTVVPGAVVTVLQFVTATMLVAAVGVAYVALAAKKRERVAPAAESTGAVALKYTDVAEIVVVATVAT